MENNSTIRILILGFVFSFWTTTNAQVQPGFNYQATIFHQVEEEMLPLNGELVEVKFSILQQSSEGQIVFKEVHETETSAYGTFNLIVGRGESLLGNTLNDLKWGQFSFFLKVEVDRGEGYELLNVEEILGAPYAFNVKNQVLSVQNSQLTISDGNSVLMDADSTNELLQSVVLDSTVLQLIDAGGTHSVDLENLLDYMTLEAVDGSITNEIQEISTDGTAGNISISSGATLKLNVKDGDADSQNEIQDLELDGHALRITGNTQATDIDLSEIATSPFQVDNGVVSNGGFDYATDDFVFGSIEMANNPTTDTDDNRFLFDKEKGAFRAGIDRFFTYVPADYQVGEDDWTRDAMGDGSIAMGRDARASGDYSIALGLAPTSSGQASTALGNSTIASGATSFAAGNAAYSSGLLSFALGDTPQSTADRSFAIGNRAQSSGEESFAIGHYASSQGLQSFALGHQSEAVNNYDFAIGNDATASGIESFAIGNLVNATGNESFALGSSSSAVGQHSVTLGSGNWAHEQGSIAIGHWNDSHGYRSIAIGNQVESHGSRSIAIGDHVESRGRESISIGSSTITRTFGEVALGILNTDYTPMDSIFFHQNDRLLVVGNGTSNYQRSDALIILKSGDTEINGQLTLDAGNNDTGFTFPSADGINGQIMSTDGAGTVSWVNAPSSSGPFSTTGNVTSNTGGVIATNDFVFGSNQLDDDPATTEDDARMFFDKSAGVFRAGIATGEQWNTANRGDNSVALGYNAQANSNASVALGFEPHAYGMSSGMVAIGYSPAASTGGSVALGYDPTAVGYGAVSLGYESFAFGNASVALGQNALVNYVNGIALGRDAEADQEQAISIGRNAYSVGLESIAIGVESTTTDEGWRGTAIGYQAVASGWNAVSIGTRDTALYTHSVAIGYQNEARGSAVSIGADNYAYTGSTAIGGGVFANGSSSTGIGTGVVTDGEYSSSVGSWTITSSQYEVALGAFNTEDPSGIWNEFIPTDRMLVIGNGESTMNRSDALVMLKNGNTTLHGQLSIDADNTYGPLSGYTLPGQDGLAGNVPQTDGSGNVSWVDPASFSSDRRLKKQINPLTSSLSVVSGLNGYTYKWNQIKNKDTVQIHSGLIAQEVQSVLPHLVVEDMDGYLKVNYVEVIPYLIEAIKELELQNSRLQDEVNMLQNNHSRQKQLEVRLNNMERVLSEALSNLEDSDP